MSKKRAGGRPSKFASDGLVVPVVYEDPIEAFNARIVEIRLADDLVKKFIGKGVPFGVAMQLRNDLMGLKDSPLEVSFPKLVAVSRKGRKRKTAPKPTAKKSPLPIAEALGRVRVSLQNATVNDLAAIRKNIISLAKQFEKRFAELYTVPPKGKGATLRRLEAEATLLEAEQRMNEKQFRRAAIKFIKSNIKRAERLGFPASTTQTYSQLTEDKATISGLKASVMDLISCAPAWGSGASISPGALDKALHLARKFFLTETPPKSHPFR